MIGKKSLWALFTGAFWGMTVLVGSAGAGFITDHLKCYKIKDELRLRGIVDIFTPQFGLEEGCRIKKAKFFCVPAEKIVVEVDIKKKGEEVPMSPQLIFGDQLFSDQICYQIKCEKPFPEDQLVADQFGARTVSKLRPKLLCGPAFNCVDKETNFSNSRDDDCDGLVDGGDEDCQ